MDERTPPPSAPIGSFVSLHGEPAPAPDRATISTIPNLPFWLRVRRNGRDFAFRTHNVVAIEEGGSFGTTITLQAEQFITTPGLSADDILAAIAAAEAMFDAEPPAPPVCATGDLDARIQHRRAQVDGALAMTEAERGASIRSLETPHLDLLLQHALALAEAPEQTHPRDWLLLVRDAIREAAVVAAAVDALADADALARTAEALEAAVPMLPPGRPAV